MYNVLRPTYNALLAQLTAGSPLCCINGCPGLVSVQYIHTAVMCFPIEGNSCFHVQNHGVVAV